MYDYLDWGRRLRGAGRGGLRAGRGPEGGPRGFAARAVGGGGLGAGQSEGSKNERWDDGRLERKRCFDNKRSFWACASTTPPPPPPPPPLSPALRSAPDASPSAVIVQTVAVERVLIVRVRYVASPFMLAGRRLTSRLGCVCAGRAGRDAVQQHVQGNASDGTGPGRGRAPTDLALMEALGGCVCSGRPQLRQRRRGPSSDVRQRTCSSADGPPTTHAAAPRRGARPYRACSRRQYVACVRRVSRGAPAVPDTSAATVRAWIGRLGGSCTWTWPALVCRSSTLTAARLRT